VASDPYAGLADQAFLSIINPDTYENVGDDIEVAVSRRAPPTSFQEIVERGAESGAQGMLSMGTMAAAAGNALIGDDEGVADNISRATDYELEAAAALEGMQEFGEFMEEPTLEGFVTQSGLALGQAAPTLATTIVAALASGGTAALVGLAGRGAISATSQITAKRVLKEAVENTIKDVATPDEKMLANNAYRAFRGMTFKRGAYAGALGSSYVPLTGENFSEGLEAGREPDAELAFRSMLVAAPQAALDVAVEAGLLKSFAKVAKSRAGASTDGPLALLTKEIGKGLAKGAVVEGLAEGGQEAISVANRASMDPNFTAEQAFLRIAQGTFQGSVAGTGIGAAGGAVGGVGRASSRVLDKAAKMISDGKRIQVNQQADREEFGDLDTGNTTEESTRTINAQIQALFDRTSAKQAVWVAGDLKPEWRSVLPEDNIATQVSLGTPNGEKRAFAANIPGRGLIIGKKSTVEEVINNQASDAVLGKALGYSGGKRPDASLVVQALDRDGNPVSEELTNEAGLAAAERAAQDLAPEGGSFRTISLTEALRQRKQRVDAEKAPSVRPASEPSPTEQMGLFDTEVEPEAETPPAIELTGDLGKAAQFALQNEAFTVSQLQRHLRTGFNKTQGYLKDLADRGLVETNDLGTWRLKDAGPTVRNMDVASETDRMGYGSESITFNEDAASLLDERGYAFGETSEETEIVSMGKRKRDPNEVFENTQEARDAYDETFGEQDWNDPFWGGVTESLLKKAVDTQREFPTQRVVIEEAFDGYVLKREGLSRDSLDPAAERKLLLGAISKAKRSVQARLSPVKLVTEGGKSTKVNLVDLVSAGRELVRRRDPNFFQGASPMESTRRGLLEVIGELSLEGNQVEVFGQPLGGLLRSGQLSRGQISDEVDVGRIVAGFQNGKPVTLSQLFPSGKRPEKQGQVRMRVKQFDGKAEGEKGAFQKEYVFTYDSFEEAAQAKDAFTAGNPNVADKGPYFETEILGFDEDAEPSKMLSDPFADPEQIFSEDGRDDTVPLSRLNIESNPRFEINRSGSSHSGPTTRRTTADYIGDVDTLTQKVIDTAIKALRLRKPVVVVGSTQGFTLPDSAFKDPRIANAVKEQIAAVQGSPAALGRYLGFNDAHVIVVDINDNLLQTSLIASHELGHALFQEELSDTLNKPGQYFRLFRSWSNARNREDAPSAWQGPTGFEEWFADQVASWAQSIYLDEKRTAKDATESIFKRIAQRIVRMYQALSAEMKRRFGKEARSFHMTEYLNDLVATNRRNLHAATNRMSGRDATYQQRLLIRAMEDSVKGDPKAQAAAKRVLGAVSRLLKNKGIGLLMAVLLPEDNILRSINPNIANMFYRRSSENKDGEVGFLNAKTNARNKILNDLEDLLGDNWDTEEVQAGFSEAATDTPTGELTDETAVKIRRFLERLYDNYISKVPGAGIGRRDDYFPVALDLPKIYEDPDAFIEVIKKYKPKLQADQIRETVDGLVSRYQDIITDAVDIDFDATNPQSVLTEARTLTDGVPPQELAQFLLPPELALLKYIRQVVIRVEFKRATTNPDGTDKLGLMLDKLEPEQRAEAVRIIERYLGYTKNPLNPKLQKFNSWMQLFNWVTLLPLATIGSIPEFGGAVINSKEFGGVTEAMKQIVNTVQNREEAVQLARDLGVTVSTTMANLGLTEADDEFLDPRVRQWSDKFFKGIGLNAFTRFTREFASNMGVQFLLTHSKNEAKNPRATRYLSDLGVTAEQVLRWEEAQGDRGYTFEGEDGAAVKKALVRFVESSMLRPNAAERPAWANDPRFALIWSLKSYLYSFSKVIVGGLMREVRVRLAEGDTTMDKLTGAGMSMALAGAAFMPLAMMSLELRELSKYLLSQALPGVDKPAARYFRSDRMDWGEYLGETFDRAGYAGPLSILGMMSKSAEWGGSGLAPLLGPTFGLLVDDIALGALDGDGLSILPKRIIPGYSIVL